MIIRFSLCTSLCMPQDCPIAKTCSVWSTCPLVLTLRLSSWRGYATRKYASVISLAICGLAVLCSQPGSVSRYMGSLEPVTLNPMLFTHRPCQCLDHVSNRWSLAGSHSTVFQGKNFITRQQVASSQPAAGQHWLLHIIIKQCNIFLPK